MNVRKGNRCKKKNVQKGNKNAKQDVKSFETGLVPVFSVYLIVHGTVLGSVAGQTNTKIKNMGRRPIFFMFIIAKIYDIIPLS